MFPLFGWVAITAAAALIKGISGSDDDYSYSGSDSEVLSKENAQKKLKKKRDAQKRKQYLLSVKSKTDAFLEKHYYEEEDKPKISNLGSRKIILIEVRNYSKRTPSEIRKLSTSRSTPKAQVRKLDKALSVMEGLDQ